MTIRKGSEPETFELDGTTLDFHIRLEDNEWVVDAFYSNREEPNQAHLETRSFDLDDFDVAIDYCFMLDKEHTKNN